MTKSQNGYFIDITAFTGKMLYVQIEVILNVYYLGKVYTEL